MNIQQLERLSAGELVSRRSRHGTVARRQFLKTGVMALAVGAGMGQKQTAWAEAQQTPSSGDPKPIPYGSQFLFPDPTVFHVEAPGYPPPGPFYDPAIHNPITIDDFNGAIGLTYVGGHGTNINLLTHEVTPNLYWEVDMRFMVGEYVAKDGQHRHGAFGLV